MIAPTHGDIRLPAITFLLSKDLVSDLHGDDEVRKERRQILIRQGPSGWHRRCGKCCLWEDMCKGTHAPPPTQMKWCALNLKKKPGCLNLISYTSMVGNGYPSKSWPPRRTFAPGKSRDPFFPVSVLCDRLLHFSWRRICAQFQMTGVRFEFVQM